LVLQQKKKFAKVGVYVQTTKLFSSGSILASEYYTVCCH